MNHKYDSTIIRAESMTDTDPHGALTLLYGHKDSLCAGPADSALYELAYTEAVHGLDVKLTNSRYINESVAYFDRCGDKRRRARALVQLALCLYDNGQLHDAVLNLKITEKCRDN